MGQREYSGTVFVCLPVHNHDPIIRDRYIYVNSPISDFHIHAFIRIDLDRRCCHDYSPFGYAGGVMPPAVMLQLIPATFAPLRSIHLIASVPSCVMIRSPGTKIGAVAFSVYDLTVCVLDKDLMARHKFIFWHRSLRSVVPGGNAPPGGDG